MPDFRLLGSIIKKYMKVADPLKKSRLLFFGCFDLESGRIKLSRPWYKVVKRGFKWLRHTFKTKQKMVLMTNFQYSNLAV